MIRPNLDRFASAAASAGYLTVSETFPMEIRAMVIAFFYAIATAVGGILGPIFFGNLIATETRGRLLIGYLVGAGVMVVAGLAHRFLGVAAEQRGLEDIAAPLSVEDAREDEAERPEAADRAEPEPKGRGADRPRQPGGRRYPPPGGYAALPLAVSGSAEDREIAGETEILVRALAEAGPATRKELNRRVRARSWGPGRFGGALRTAVAAHRIQRAGHGRYMAAPEEQERLGTGGR